MVQESADPRAGGSGVDAWQNQRFRKNRQIANTNAGRVRHGIRDRGRVRDLVETAVNDYGFVETE